MLAGCFAPVCTLVGKTWGAAPREGRPRRPRGEPRDDRRVGRVPRRARASASSTTPSTSSTASATTPATRCECLRAAAAAGAEQRRALRHERLVAARRRSPRRPRAVVAALGADAACASASTRTTTPAAAWPTRSPPSRPGRAQVQGTMNGIGERTGNANLVTIIADLQLKMGHDVVSRERSRGLTEAAHFVDELLNRTPDPDQPYVGQATPSPTRAGCTSRASAPTRRRSSTSTPALVGNRARAR